MSDLAAGRRVISTCRDDVVSDKLQKRTTSSIRESTQYVLTFGVIATLLIVANFPMVVIFFFGVFAYLLWKTFTQPSGQGVKEVFEFYMNANEVLRGDDRRWFGFELREVISQGERILELMHGAPPLVYFTLGALYNKIGDHQAAVNHLSYVVENENADEATYIHPSGDLKRYVRLLRKIEREPKEAPKTSAAIRSLERSRKNRGIVLLEESRKKLSIETRDGAVDRLSKTDDGERSLERARTAGSNGSVRGNRVKPSGERKDSERPPKRAGWRFAGTARDDDDLYSDRKPITEVLHDIYDKNIQ